MNRPRSRPNSPDTSAIARRLLLTRRNNECPETPVLLLPVSGTKLPVQNTTVSLPQQVEDSKPPTQEASSLRIYKLHRLVPNRSLPEEVQDVKPSVDDIEYEWSDSECSSELDEFMEQLARARENQPIECYAGICGRIHSLRKERFMALHAGNADVPVLGRRSKIVIRRVRQFFEEFKKILGDECEGTIFSSTVELTAWACGITPDTVTRIGVKEDFVHELFPRTKKKKTCFSFAKEKEITIKKYEDEWGEVIRDFIRHKMSKDKDMTSNRLHAELCREYSHFPIARGTLYTFLNAMGVKFYRVNGRRMMSI
ncbi:hypothetical protein NECAME_09571 [Necator americanus]|uniref:Uncharacterized protein n=1 Tax=Necator americanus TaxID=51031 RepID=W2TFB6_NECAM|nr:hypothetical protein NECAME_09571 [Necator americanus]ETN79871.1 hypothetical protein NECAME_09571 [Necator americanus]